MIQLYLVSVTNFENSEVKMTNLLLYIDPASTAIVWQILAGIFIAFGVILSIWWTKISTFFKSIFVKIFRKKEDKEKAVKQEEINEELE